MRASWQLLTRLAAVALAGVVVGAAAGCGGAIGRDELARCLQTIASVAAEGQLMAHDVSRNRARSSFVRAHARELSDSADHEGEKLADATTAAYLAGPYRGRSRSPGGSRSPWLLCRSRPPTRGWVVAPARSCGATASLLGA